MYKIFPKRISLSDGDAIKLREIGDIVDVEQKMYEAGLDGQTAISLEKLCELLKMVKGTRRHIRRAEKIENPDENLHKHIFVYLKKGELVKESLDFFKSIDTEMYNRFLKMFLLDNEFEDISLNRYHARNHFSKKYDKYFAPEDPKSRYGIIGGDRMVYLGLYHDDKAKDRYNSSKVYNLDDTCTYSSISTTVHEVSHGLDVGEEELQNRRLKRIRERLQGMTGGIPNTLNSDNMVKFLLFKRDRLGQNDINITEKEKEKIPQIAREYLTETTTVFMEYLFADHLAQKYPKIRNIAHEKNRIRARDSRTAINVVQLLSLLGIMKKSGKIMDKEQLEEMLFEYNFTENEIKKAIKEKTTSYPKRYVLADLFVPSMIEVYRRDPEAGKEKLKTYLQCVKDNDFEGALKAFEIDIYSKEGVDKLITNYQNNLRRLFPYYEENENKATR